VGAFDYRGQPLKNNGAFYKDRLWNWRALQDPLRQIQGIRTRYDFPDIDLDCYQINGIAEKLSASQTAEFFADRKKRAGFKTFDKLMNRSGGSPPRAGDEMPGKKTKAANRDRDIEEQSW
jgi:hypothetical protein